MMNAIYPLDGRQIIQGLRPASFEAVRGSGQRAGPEKLAERDRGASKSAKTPVKGRNGPFLSSDARGLEKPREPNCKLSDGACLAEPKVALFVQKQAEQP